MHERTTRRSRPDSRNPGVDGIGGTPPVGLGDDAGSDADGDAIDTDGPSP